MILSVEVSTIFIRVHCQSQYQDEVIRKDLL